MEINNLGKGEKREKEKKERKKERKEKRENFKGQVSLEMLLILSFFFLFFIPLVALVYSAINSGSWRLGVQQTDTIVKEFIDVANRVASGGEGTYSTHTFFLPNRVKQIRTEGRAVSFFVDTPEFGVIEQTGLSEKNITLLGGEDEWRNVSGVQILIFNYSGGIVRISKVK